jgi:hypothetical protein
MSGPNGYATEKDAMKAIEDLKVALKTAKVVTKKKGGKYGKAATALSFGPVAAGDKNGESRRRPAATMSPALLPETL